MTDYLNISLIQSDIIWQDTQANLEHLDGLIKATLQSDIIVLPEMFNTGFSMNPEQVAMPEDGGQVLEWMKSKSIKLNSAIVGSVAVKEGEGYYNRLYFVEPSGDISIYNKRHLFRMAGENNHFINGEERIIIEYKGWKICPQVCYDLRFPVWSRNTYNNNQYDYDVLLYVANWPAVRSDAWTSLLKARAIENLSYTIGVNRVGQDGNKINYSGNSRCFNFLGERIDSSNLDEEEVLSVSIEKEPLLKFRKKFPTGLDADKFELI